MRTSTNPLTIINAGVEISVAYRDGSKEMVKVHQLPSRKLESYARAQGDEAELVELFCEKPQGWDDLLVTESHLEILQTGEELNADPFDLWVRRMRDRLENATKTTASLSATLPKDLAQAVATASSNFPTSPQPLFSGSTRDDSNPMQS